jgi:hypothetical protein
MQTLKEVLGRQEERQNLQNYVFCFLLVLVLVLVAVGVSRTRLFSQKMPADNPRGPVTPGVP